MRNVFLTMSLLLAAFLAVGCGDASVAPTKSAGTKTSVHHVSVGEAKKMMETEKGYLLLDVRTKKEYEGGHLRGAICIPNETITEDPPPGLPDKNQRIFVYCWSGQRSHATAQKLSKMGYTNIVEFGGIMDWQCELVKGKS